MEAELAPSSVRSSWLWDLGRTLAYAFLIAVVIRTLVFQPFNIPSGSMEQTLLVGDFLFVSKYSYGYSKHSIPWSPEVFSGRIWKAEPKRGDVVVFKLPARPWEDYVKRVVGLPGDRVQMIEGVLHINGEACKLERVEDFVEVHPSGMTYNVPRYRETMPGGAVHYILDREPDRAGADDTQEFVVPAGKYFMMGDNRDNSSDSRAPESGVGFVPEENIVGRADIIFFSMDSSAKIWEVWKWPWAIRFARFLNYID
jgi:signal peptidase I